MRLLCLLIAILLSGTAGAQHVTPDFEPGKWKGPAAGAASEVLVLATHHLAQLPKTFDPAGVNLVMDRLAAWRPHAIAVEAVSGAQCDFMRRYPRRYPRRYADTFKTYCWDTAPAKAATGLDAGAATEEVDQLLATWPAAPTPAQRRHLAALFLAAGERTSALVQWLRLPAAERRAGDSLDSALVETIVKLEQSPNERYLIGARLAARLGHERVLAMDDHTADRPDEDHKAYAEALAKAWNNPATAERTRVGQAHEKDLGTAQGLLAMYRADNAPGQGKLIFDSDFGAAMNEPSPQCYGRGYLGYWETRNLRMASNIRDVMGIRPGERMLVIVGASHKAYLDAYLHQMHDIRIVDAAALLR